MAGADIAIVGAGRGGSEFLHVLTGTPNVRVKYVCDVDLNARGMVLARQHGIRSVTQISDFINDPDVGLIFEATGRQEVFDQLQRVKGGGVSLVGSAGTRAVYSLFDHLADMNRSLRSYKLNLERRIIERTEELEKANTELQQEKAASEQLYEQQKHLNEEKTKYLIHTTHQLKAPFAAIQNYMDIILDGYAGEIPGETRAILEKVKSRCLLLADNIRDMLKLARLKANLSNDSSQEPLSALALLHEVRDFFAVSAAAKRIELEIECASHELTVHSNRKDLLELVGIFVDNALRYSRSPSVVVLRAARDDQGRQRIAIEDHGIGIPPEHREHIFAEYFRANNAAHVEPNGNGLGLAIASELARQLHVELQVESVLDQGSTFSIVF